MIFEKWPPKLAVPLGISSKKCPSSRVTVAAEPWFLLRPTPKVVYGVTTVTHFNPYFALGLKEFQ